MRPSGSCAARDSRSLQIEFEQARQNITVRVIKDPAVRGDDCGVEVSVSVGEPGRAIVVELGQGPLREIGRIRAGRIKPSVAELDEAACSLPYPGALFGRRILREREGLEAGCGRIATNADHLAAQGVGPGDVDARMENPHCVVVVAGEHDQLMIWQHVRGEPNKETMLRNSWRCDVPFESGQRGDHLWAPVVVNSPTVATTLLLHCDTVGPDHRLYVLERCFVQRRLLLGHGEPEVNDPDVS